MLKYTKIRNREEAPMHKKTTKLFNVSVHVLCIGGLFAIRKFLISRKDLVRELSEGEGQEDIKSE